MTKRAFQTFLLVAALFAVAIPFWAIQRDGNVDASPVAVAEEDREAKELFQDNCGTCHTMRVAGTDGVIGPNLDERITGSENAGAEGQVLNAILNGFQGPDPGVMPAGIMQGEDAELVANFVARVAGR